jgi:hypothetical protein
MLKVLVIGWFDQGNIGDESYKLAFQETFPYFQFQFVNHIKQANPSSFDIVFLGGGDILSPLYLDQIKGLKKPVIAVSVSSNTKLSAASLEPIRQLYIRDSGEMKHKCIRRMPDLAFALEPNVKSGKEIIDKSLVGCEKYKYKVAVVINSHLFSDAERQSSHYDQLCFSKFAYDLAWVMDNSPYNFVFVPFGTKLPHDDRAANGFVLSRSKFYKKNSIIYDTLTAQQTLDVISACDAVISTRLHSSIFATIGGVPFVDVTHNHKNKLFIESIDKYKWSVSYKQFEQADCKKLLDGLIGSSDTHKSSLNAINQVAKERLKEEAKCLSILINSII